ncbi:L,D-transpeptidase family protein [Microbacterium sp. Root166]|uniref:L,D-transpeptidase family protein n=1 Tax=Microbacterium sp. Root166 TaxID=1736478 RepID=UPI001F2D14BD|nr:L,D-transpeptidase family protein [Microbacterium sp. Root166]
MNDVTDLATKPDADAELPKGTPPVVDGENQADVEGSTVESSTVEPESAVEPETADVDGTDEVVDETSPEETTVVLDDASPEDTTVVLDEPAVERDADPVDADPADADPADATGEVEDATVAMESTHVGAAPTGNGPDAPAYAWAPAEPKPRKSRKALWIGLGAGVAVTGLVASSLVLIAPGTSIAGVSVGWLTPGAAAEAVQARLANTTIVLTGAGGDVEVTGADLGASVDATGLAETAFAEHPMWNVTAWFPPADEVVVQLDDEAATSVLRAAAPELYADPVDAQVEFDAASTSYVTVPAEPGSGIDLETVRQALTDAFASGQSEIELPVEAVPVEADIPTHVAEGTVGQLNTILDTAGFYIGAERTVPIDRATAASWLTVAPGDDDTFEITADAAAIQPHVDTLAAAVNRAPENAKVITDSAGKVLREESGGQSGREVGDTSNVASDFASQLAEGSGAFALPVNEVPVTTVALARRIEVDLGDQRTYMFENGNLVQSYAISSGRSATPTPTGSFRVYAHTAEQDLGAACRDPSRTDSYCTKDVKWLTWFAPDIAFHATYWHNNFGNPMSHGCVNMPTNVAEFVYRWAPVGTEVWVHG